MNKEGLQQDGPSVLFLTATLSWPLAVILAGFALRQAGKPFFSCVLLGLSSIFTLHASPLGPPGMLFFLLAALRIERSGQLLAAGLDAGFETAAFLSSKTVRSSGKRSRIRCAVME